MMRMRYEKDDARTNWIQTWPNYELQVNKLGTKNVNTTERELGGNIDIPGYLKCARSGSGFQMREK